LIPSADVIATSEVIATIPAEAGLVESVVRHPSSKMLIASSVSGQSLHVLLPSDVWANVPMPQVSDLSGIVWEPHTGMNWIASSNIDGSEDDEHVMEGLLGVLDCVQPTAFAQAPDGSKISDLAVALDGTIFASDPINGGIYAKLAGADASLDEFVPPGTFRSPQGLATSADNTKLYVSDYRYGIAIVDLETREVSRLASDIPVILDGVDGLWRFGSELIAMQNGTSPMRISAFELSEDGMRVVGHRVLEQANPDWTEPLSGSIDGDALIYVGNGQWDRYFQGELKQGMEPLPTQIRRLPLGPRTE
jgi:DNA-binding beta-propeller fold protein YncE